MSRPYTDISKAISANPIKNGSVVGSTLNNGSSSLQNNSVKNTPALPDIDDKYGNRFYNGVWVNVISGDIDGGTSL